MNVLEAERAVESLSYLKSESRSDYASDEAFANFREVQGGTIKPKKLYRASSPLLCDERSFCAEKCAAEAGIQTIVNLSDSQKSAEEHFDEAPHYKSVAKKGGAIFLEMGVSFYGKQFLKKLHDAFAFLAGGKSAPILIHCNEGKDRTGFVCTIFEALCVATIAEIERDYMKSYENYFDVQRGTELYNLIANEPIDFLKKNMLASRQKTHR